MKHRELTQLNEALRTRVIELLTKAGRPIAQTEESRLGRRFTTSGLECHISVQSSHTVTVSQVTVYAGGNWTLSAPPASLRAVLETAGLKVEPRSQSWRVKETQAS